MCLAKRFCVPNLRIAVSPQARCSAVHAVKGTHIAMVDCVHRQGVYALYKGKELHYVGLAEAVNE